MDHNLRSSQQRGTLCPSPRYKGIKTVDHICDYSNLLITNPTLSETKRSVLNDKIVGLFDLIIATLHHSFKLKILYILARSSSS